jgi:Ca2+-transporting ATPase
MTDKHWHSLDLQDVFAQIGSSVSGLAKDEVEKRLSQFGKNELPPEKQSPAWILFVRQFNSPLMYIMMVATAISFFVNNLSEAIFILIVLVSNAIVGFYQEYKANASLRALKGVIKLRARVIRDNREQEIDAVDIVPGDILIIRAGDRVPADGRIIEGRTLKINEATLTGESKAVQKNAGASVDSEAEIGDRLNMVFMGSVVEEGLAKVIVLETGVRTQYGDIVMLLKETEEEPTPLQLMTVSLSKIVGLGIFAVTIIIVIEGYFTGRSLSEIFEVALALFISGIPEGLLPAITIVLALGMRRILKQKGLVRRLASTETLGGVTVICTDKTGTLTEGKMAVTSIVTADQELSSDQLHDKKFLQSQASTTTQKLVLSGLLSNDAFVENPGAENSELIIRGTLTEQALLRIAIQFGFDKYEEDKKNELIDQILFSSDHKYSASLRKISNTHLGLYVIGAPEQILKRTQTLVVVDKEVDNTTDEYKKVLAKLDDFVSQGYRVVASAYKTIPIDIKYDDLHEVIREMSLLGFIVLTDPIREDVVGAFAETNRAGIRTVVVTGDHKQTASVIAQKIGFDLDPSQIVEGHDIEAMDEDTLQERSKTIALYARVSPRHKLRIVNALQRNNEVVAMFGDGVNDAPALKAADIGVAVGTQVDAVREVADIVLLTSGFKTIVKAIEQGRIIFSNIRKVFLYLIVQDFSQFFLFMVSILVGLPLPLIATQLLLVNLVESGLPDLALTTEQEKDGIMNEPPRPPKSSILDKSSKIFMVSLFLMSGTVATLFYFATLYFTQDIDKTRTMMMVLMCFESLFLVFAMRSFKKPIFRKDIFSNCLLFGAVLISLGMVLVSVHLPYFQKVFSTQALPMSSWAVIICVSLLQVSIVDKLKIYVFTKRWKL